MGQFLRGLDINLDVEITHDGLTKHGHALALEAELLAIFSPLGNFDPCLCSIQCCDFKLTAEGSGRHRNGNLAVKVCTIALEEDVRLDRDKNIKIALRPAANTSLALAGQTNARAIFDTGWNVD